MADSTDAADTDHGGADPLAALPATAQRMLRHVARFGFLAADQAARLDGLGLPSVRLAFHHLHVHRLIRTIHPTWGPGQHSAYALNRRSRTWLSRTADPPTMPKAPLDRLDELLAAVDLAMQLEGHGAGRWRTWCEWRLEHPRSGRARAPEDPVSLSPAGVLEMPDGNLRPIWVLLHRRGPAMVRDAVLSVCGGGPFRWGEIYALPEICGALERLFLSQDLHTWVPPHLGGRPPLLPGWWKAGDGKSGGALTGNTRSGAHLRLGPAGVETLRYLDRFGYGTATQIARACGRRSIDEMVVLARLLSRGLAQRHGGARGMRPHAWSATRTGLAAIGSARQAPPAEPLHRRHSLALNDLAHDLTAQTGGTWEAEREVRTSEGRVKRRSDLLPPPDGRLALPDGRRACIQLQLSPGQVNRQYGDAHTYRGRGLCDEVWFVCAPDVAPRYRRALRPGDVGLIQVSEWVAPDHSGGHREVEPWQRARWKGGRTEAW